jgi:hypothetical protein
MSDNPPSKNPPFGGSIAAETFLRLSPDDRQQAAELLRPKHAGDLLWLVQYCKHTAHYGASNAFDSGLGFTTNWEHAKESSQQKDWKVVAYRIKPKDRATKIREVHDICDISPHGFGKWSPQPPQNGKSDALVGTSDNCESRKLRLSNPRLMCEQCFEL